MKALLRTGGGGVRRAAHRLVQAVLRFVMLRDGGDIVGMGLGQGLLRLEVFQHDAHSVLLALAR